MTIHHRRAGGGLACGLGPAPGDASTIYWNGVTCPDCLAIKPADAGGRMSIKRSHRAEGDSFVD